MITALVSFFLARGASPKNARGYAWGIAILAAVLLIGGVGLGIKSCIIHQHDLGVEASAAKADRIADQKAAVQKEADVARQQYETDQLTQAVNHAAKNPNVPDDRERALAFHRCLRLQQAAHQNGLKPPRCV